MDPIIHKLFGPCIPVYLKNAMMWDYLLKRRPTVWGKFGRSVKDRAAQENTLRLNGWPAAEGS